LQDYKIIAPFLEKCIIIKLLNLHYPETTLPRFVRVPTVDMRAILQITFPDKTKSSDNATVMFATSDSMSGDMQHRRQKVVRVEFASSLMYGKAIFQLVTNPELIYA
jgi:hypothetical protein